MSAPSKARRCWAEIDRTALRHNVDVARAQLAPGAKVMAIIKANAYGHGIGGVAEALAGHAEMFGVANVTEAEEVLARVPDAAIFILGPALPDERQRIVDAGFVPSISTVEEARAFAAYADPEPVAAHLIIDTGMGRIGILETEAVAMVREILQVRGLKVTGIASHLPVADEDDAFTREQLTRFHRIVGELRALGLNHPVIHIENSAATLAHPQQAEDMVRVGLMIYGSSPLPEFQSKLRAVMTWKTRITLVRNLPAGHGVSYGRTFITPTPMRIATLGVGYADGYQRHLSNRGAEVLIRGRRCAVLGRVTMDQILVDVTALPEVEAGEEVVLMGRQGDGEIPAAELAKIAGTIPWEIFTGVGRRVGRVYFG